MSQTDVYEYLNKQYAKKATVIVPSSGTNRTQAIFQSCAIAVQPADLGVLPPITERFTFYINGVGVELDAIVSFEESGNDCILTMDTTQLGFNLESSDEVYAIGKFDS